MQVCNPPPAGRDEHRRSREYSASRNVAPVTHVSKTRRSCDAAAWARIGARGTTISAGRYPFMKVRQSGNLPGVASASITRSWRAGTSTSGFRVSSAFQAAREQALAHLNRQKIIEHPCSDASYDLDGLHAVYIVLTMPQYHHGSLRFLSARFQRGRYRNCAPDQGVPRGVKGFRCGTHRALVPTETYTVHRHVARTTVPPNAMPIAW